MQGPLVYYTWFVFRATLLLPGIVTRSIDRYQLPFPSPYLDQLLEETLENKTGSHKIRNLVLNVSWTRSIPNQHTVYICVFEARIIVIVVEISSQPRKICK